MPFWLWLKGTAWPWLKKHWRWVILFPAMLVVWLLGRRSGSVTVIDSRKESSEAAELKAKLEAQAAEAKEEAKQEARAKSMQLLQDHEKAVNELSAEQQGKMQELLDEPEKLNSFLLDVGKGMRK
jgi:hypothetical protein